MNNSPVSLHLMCPLPRRGRQFRQVILRPVLNVGIAVLLLVAFLVLLVRNRIVEEFRPIREDGVNFEYEATQDGVDPNGRRFFRTALLLASEEPFKFRVWYERVPDQQGNPRLSRDEGRSQESGYGK